MAVGLECRVRQGEAAAQARPGRLLPGAVSEVHRHRSRSEAGAGALRLRAAARQRRRHADPAGVPPHAADVRHLRRRLARAPSRPLDRRGAARG